MRASKHWLHQRVTAIVLCLFMPGFWWLFKATNTYSYGDLHAQLSRPIPVLLISLSFLFILYHSRLGLSVVIEDYTQHMKRKILLTIVDSVLLLLLLSFFYAFLLILKGI